MLFVFFIVYSFSETTYVAQSNGSLFHHRMVNRETAVSDVHLCLFLSHFLLFIFFSFYFPFAFWSSLAVTVVTVKSNDHLSLSIKGGSELVEDERTQLSRAICSEINLRVVQ